MTDQASSSPAVTLCQRLRRWASILRRPCLAPFVRSYGEDDYAAMACAFSDAAVALETADAEVDALVTQALAKAGGERPQGVHIDPEQTLAMHLIQELKPDCCCAVCQVLREYCEETFRDQDPPS